MHIIGTAGHVDHGKSALVRALTGTDPDRWAEEQRRGMTLDLGFAQLVFPDGVEAGIIDVPGHERFLHNMLAGAAGMELVLLVVAANEGAMPQTLEHLAILTYLNVRRIIVVLSKVDTIDPAERSIVEADLRLALRDTLARDAPVHAVSTLTGAGLAALRDAIHTELVALPPRAPNAPAYLPIDRVFARTGHGTVVTGTLMQGRVRVGDTLALSPADRPLRVRGLQVFGEKRAEVSGGTRVAINLPGIETTEIARGAVLASSQFVAASSFAVTFRPLPSALELLRRRMPVRAYIGSAEILGTLVFERAPTAPGDVAAHLYLRAPTIAVPNAPFVVRRVSPMNVLGGGIIAATSDAAEVTTVPPADREVAAVLAAIDAAGLSGMTPAAIGSVANLASARVAAIVEDLVASGQVRTLAKPAALIAVQVADATFSAALARLTERQRERPWLMGMTSLALANLLATPEPALIRILAIFVESGALAYRGGYYATTDFTPRLRADQRAFFDDAFAAHDAAVPLSHDELRTRVKNSGIADLAPALEMLLTSGALVRVGEFVYTGSQLATIRAQLEAALRRAGQITVADFRTLTGTTRKYAVPLLEFFDATGVTIRSGDIRVLRGASLQPR